MSGLKALNAKQAGLATLMSAIVLLMVISMISVYTARVSVTEQKISSNQYRSQQAFEAAEAGLNSAIYNLNMDIVHRALCVGSEIETSGICKGHSAGTGVGTEADFTGEQALVSLQANKTGDFSLTFSKNPDNDNIVNFSVYGYASDNPRQDEAPNQILRQSLLMRPVLNYHPPAPLIARSTLTLRSPTMITNKDIDSLAAFWSGGAAILLGLPMVDVVSTNGLETGGYYQNDDVLAGLDRGNPSGSPAKPNKFFENFFSDTFVNLKNRSLKLVCRTGCDETDLSGLFDMSGNPLGNHIIWVDANAGSGFEKLSVNNAIDLGTLENPILLVVDGELEINNPGINIFGVVYVTRNVTVNAAGRLVGSLISEQSIVSNGVFNVIYREEVFDNMDMKMAYFYRIAGSWKDF